MALQGKTTVIKRGSTSDNNLLLGAKGEIVVNETTKSLRVHTGTRGGTELLRADMANLDTGVSSVIDFNGARLRDIGSPVASTDAATKAYVDAHGGGGGSSTLDGLSDVALGTLSSGELLQYDGSTWINSTISLSDLSDSATVATKTYVDTEIGSLGTASTYDVGTGANNVVKLDGSSRLPAVDGSLLIGVVVSGGLLATNNLSDLGNSATARTNLGLGSVATLNSNAVLQVSNNLSEVTASTARTNLGLGNVATLSTGTSNGQVPLAQNVAILSGGKIDGSVLPDLAITQVTSGLFGVRPAATVDNQGDVYIATDTSQTFISTGSDWSEILNLNSASIADLLGDMGNVKSSFGAIINSEDASWVGFDGTNYLNSTTNLKTSLEALDTQIKSNTNALGSVLTTSSTLNDLGDVNISVSPSRKFLKNNGTNWVDSVIDHTDVEGLGSSALKTAGVSPNNVLLLDGTGYFSGSLISDNSVTSSKISGDIPVSIVSGLGTSATINVGTDANKIVQLNGTGQLPAVSGALLTGITAAQVSGISGTYAPLLSPALTGTPTAPTATLGDTTIRIATTEFVQNNAINAVKYALEHGYSLNVIGGTINLTQGSVSLGSSATATTQTANDNTTKVATTAYVQTELSDMVLNDLSDVVITGTPSNNQVLKYNGTNWVNGTATATVSNLDDIGDVAVTGAIAGDILKYDGSQWVNKKPSIALNYVALTDTNITLASGKYYTYTSATDTTQKNILTLPSNASLSSTGGETIYVAIVDSVADSNNNYVLKAGTNTQIIYEDVILAEASELSLSTTGLYTITHVKRDGTNRYYVTLNKSVTSSAIAVAKTINLTGAVTGSVSLNNQNSAVNLNTTLGTITNSDLQYDSIYIGSHTLSLGGTLNLSGLTVSGSTLSVNQISLGDLSGVALGALSTGQVLKYNGTNWVNGTDNSGGGGGGGGDVYLANNNTFTGDNTFNGDYLLVESVTGEDKFKVDTVADTIDMFTPATLDDAYIYVKFDNVSWMNDFFYVFTSHDNGITRQVVPLTLIQDSGTDYLQKITSWNMVDTYTFDYSVYSANGFMQYTNPSDVPNASFKRDPNLTYYISSWNRNQMGSPDFGLAVSDSNNGLGLTYVDLAGSGSDVNMVEKIYKIIANEPTIDNTLDPNVYVYDTRTTSLANFDKATDITTLTRLEVDTYAVVNKLVVNSTVTLNGAIDLGSSATATTPSANDNTTKVATTAYVQTELSNMVLNDLSDVQTGGLASNQLLKWNGSYWLNGSIASTDLSNTSNIPLLDTSNIFTNDLTIQKNESTPIVTSDVYLYVRYQNFSLADGEIFYVFSTSDGGATRQVLPFTLMTDSGVNYLQEDNIFAYKRYKPATAVTYNNSSNAPNASIGFEAGTTYYIEGSTSWDDSGTPNDIEVFFSSSSSATPTWTKLFPDDTGTIPSPPLIKTYEIVLESILSPVSLTPVSSITNRPSSTVTVSDMIVLNKDTGNLVSNGFIQLKKQNAHPSTVSDHAHVYAKVDTTDTEIYVQDSAGNNTRLSSHNEEGEWEYYSYNKRTGKSIRINMEKMIRTLEALTGEKFIIEE